MSTRVASIVAEVGIDGKKFDSGLKSIMSGITGMKGGFGQLAGAVGIAGIAFGVISTQMKKAVDITVTYADEVRTLSSITNQSAEETSRMIQVLDDYKLTSQQAGMAARFLAKEGLSLNIETLAKLSDEYKTFNTGQEKATFLMKNFGKAGQDFALIMDQGSDAILRQGDAVNKGLILGEKELRQARELEIATDDLEDSKQALYTTVGTKLIPVWTDYLDSLLKVAEGENILKVIMGNLTWFIKDEAKELSEADIIAQKFAGSIKDIATEAETTDDVIRGLSDAEESFLTSTREMTPKAVAEFITLETKIAQVKKMIAAGASFNVIVNFLAGKTIMVDPSSMAPAQNPGAPAKKEVKKGKVNEANGGPVNIGGWTMVGEQGFELIDPSGMVHSNPDSKKLIKAGVTPWKKLATGGNPWEGGAYDWQNTSTQIDPVWSWGDSATVNAILPSTGSGGGGGGSSAVIQTAAAASQSASQAAQQTSRAVDVTAQMSTQMASSSAAQMASLASIDRRLANLPSQLRDVFQQVIQQ